MKEYLLAICIIFFVSCNDRDPNLNGHWHEYVNDDLWAVYNISDSIFSVNEFSNGYKGEIKFEGGSAYIPFAGGWTSDYFLGKEAIKINDTIIWKRMSRPGDCFLADISAGLLVSVEPPELLKGDFDLEYDEAYSYIFVGARKLQKPQFGTKNFYHIQLNDVLASDSRVTQFLETFHGDNKNRVLAISADKATPDSLLASICLSAVRAGYRMGNIYRTSVDTKNMRIGLTKLN